MKFTVSVMLYHLLCHHDLTLSVQMTVLPSSGHTNGSWNAIGRDSSVNATNGIAPRRGMVLPFTPLAMSFDEVNYYVDMPAVSPSHLAMVSKLLLCFNELMIRKLDTSLMQEMKEQGVAEDRLQLLRGVTGAFRPGVLTALMGVSGAGKTTLMDVLAGRKTGGYIEGDVRISGYPKNQATFARISGYCEQNDIHSPQVTVRESLIYSAFLRLPKEVTDAEKMVSLCCCVLLALILLGFSTLSN